MRLRARWLRQAWSGPLEMWRAFRQCQALPSRERRLLLLLMLLQPLISLGLRLRGYRNMRGWLERDSANRNPRAASSEDLATAQRTAELAAIAGRRGPVAATCLRQSLAVFWLLRRQGLLPEIRFGVDRVGATPDMHAWVELEGIPLAQPQLRHREFQPATSASTAATTESNAS